MAEIERCLDTYALVEISEGNPKFAKYLNVDFVITDLTLAEFYGVLLRGKGENTAEYWYKKLEIYSFPLDRQLLVEAIKFRYSNKKLGLSFFDAVGYVFALKKGICFVTGDKAFEKLRGVEFIKK